MSIQIYEEIVNGLKDKEAFVIFIDGYTGSGKSGLGRYLSDKLNANLISIDDYYLPFNKRDENWFEISGGNIDYQRIISEVINPYLNKEDLKLKKYNPHNDTYKELELQKHNSRLIIEGSYSFMDDIIDYSTYRIFLKCNKDKQKERLLKRELENYINFENKWIKKEELYYKDKSPETKADLVVDTSDLF